MSLSGLHVILDRDVLGDRDPIRTAERLISAGVRVLQYRDKKHAKREQWPVLTELSRRTRQENCLLIVNDEPDLALAVGADGVHLGQDDLPLPAARIALGPDRIIGISTHSVEEAAAAQRDGADYIGLGPIFETRTKPGRSPLGSRAIRDVRAAVRIPIIAIGGITLRNLPEVLAAGADGAAVITAVLSQDDIEKAARDLLAVFGHRRQCI
jgi:thiamine-phosphate pyrophosphorylase